MKKRCMGALFACTLFTTAALMTGCTAKPAESSSADDGIVVIKMSDDAKKYEKEDLAASGEGEALKEGNIERIIQRLSERTEQVLPECELENQLALEMCEGSKVYTLTKDNYENIVLYIHGGAWIFEITKNHVYFCDELATRLNAKVYMPLYPLAPQANSEETYHMIETLYPEILKEGKKVYLMGDSAGGNLSLGLMYTIKQEGLTKPEKMVLLSPCTDVEFANPGIEEIEKTDPLLTSYGARMCTGLWAGEENLKNPKNSVLYADVTGYPDTLLIQGTNEITYPDNMIFYQQMKDAGVNITLVKGEGLFHVFPIYPIPECIQSLDLIEKFCIK